MYKVLRRAREERGAIDFETVETRIEFNENRKIERIVPVYRNDAHKIIEECMLCANVSAANFLTKHRLDRKSTRLNSSHVAISYAVFCLKKKTNIRGRERA